MNKRDKACALPTPKLTLEERIAVMIIHGGKDNSGFYGRGGFDHWWDCVEDEDADELWDELLNNIREALATK